MGLFSRMNSPFLGIIRLYFTLIATKYSPYTGQFILPTPFHALVSITFLTHCILFLDLCPVSLCDHHIRHPRPLHSSLSTVVTFHSPTTPALLLFTPDSTLTHSHTSLSYALHSHTTHDTTVHCTRLHHSHTTVSVHHTPFIHSHRHSHTKTTTTLTHKVLLHNTIPLLIFAYRSPTNSFSCSTFLYSQPKLACR